MADDVSVGRANCERQVSADSAWLLFGPNLLHLERRVLGKERLFCGDHVASVASGSIRDRFIAQPGRGIGGTGFPFVQAETKHVEQTRRPLAISRRHKRNNGRIHRWSVHSGCVELDELSVG